MIKPKALLALYKDISLTSLSLMRKWIKKVVRKAMPKLMKKLTANPALSPRRAERLAEAASSFGRGYTPVERLMESLRKNWR